MELGGGKEAMEYNSRLASYLLHVLAVPGLSQWYLQSSMGGLVRANSIAILSQCAHQCNVVALCCKL